MADFSSVQALMNYLKKQISDVLQTDVKEEVISTEQRHIQSDLYDAYSPNFYERRGTLADEGNFESEMIDDSTIAIKNVATPNDSVVGTLYNPANGTEFMSWIEYGDVPDLWGDGSEPWSNPRPVVGNTVKELEETEAHVKALKEGLLKKGIQIT
jgi:hypothetical protein